MRNCWCAVPMWCWTYNYFYYHGPITLHARFVLLSTDPFVWKLCVAVLSRLFFGAVSCESCNYLQTLSDQQTIFKLCIFPPSSYSLMNLNRRSSCLENHHFLIQMWKMNQRGYFWDIFLPGVRWRVWSTITIVPRHRIFLSRVQIIYSFIRFIWSDQIVFFQIFHVF